MKLTPWLAMLVWAAAPFGAESGAAEVFADDLRGWVVEQQPGGTVTAHDGVLTIDDKAGVTVWRREPLRAPVRIRFTATLTGGEDRRISDLNCFWMATDPRSPGDFFDAAKTGRDGKFASYDGLRTYYVGCGGNGNTTTRFRRYDGHGARPLRPEHDRKEKDALLEKGRSYAIEINVDAQGRTTWARDGVVWLSHGVVADRDQRFFGKRALSGPSSAWPRGWASVTRALAKQSQLFRPMGAREPKLYDTYYNPRRRVRATVVVINIEFILGFSPMTRGPV